MAERSVPRRFHWLFLGYLMSFFIQNSLACQDSYQCHFGQHCCSDNTCKPSCHPDHETNVGIIIGIVTAVALGNILFWVAFCCLCWCHTGKKHTFRYRPFSDKQTDEDNEESTKVIADTEEDLNSRAEEIALSIIKLKSDRRNKSDCDSDKGARALDESSSRLL